MSLRKTVEKAIGEKPTARSLIVPSTNPFGEKEVSKVFTNDMKFCAILNLNHRIQNSM